MITGHGKTRAYLQRFKLAESAICPCNKEDQTLDHILNRFALFHTQRNTLKKNDTATGRQVKGS